MSVAGLYVGVYLCVGCVARSDCGISVVPVDDDLLSMEMPEAFKVGGGADVDAVHCMGHRLALVGGCGVIMLVAAVLDRAVSGFDDRVVFPEAPAR